MEVNPGVRAFSAHFSHFLTLFPSPGRPVGVLSSGPASLVLTDLCLATRHQSVSFLNTRTFPFPPRFLSSAFRAQNERAQSVALHTGQPASLSFPQAMPLSVPTAKLAIPRIKLVPPFHFRTALFRRCLRFRALSFSFYPHHQCQTRSRQ